MAGGMIIMAILGCGDSGTQCEPAGRAPVAYESVAACAAAQASVLASVNVDYPVVVAQCRSSNGVVPGAASKAGPKRPPVRLASAPI